MNSKQRRQLRREKLPELINLLAIKRITGDLHPWVNTTTLIAVAAKNPQRIEKAIPFLTDDDGYCDAEDFESLRSRRKQ